MANTWQGDSSHACCAISNPRGGTSSWLGAAAAAGAAAARAGVGDLQQVVGVGLDDVDLPGLLAGAGDPDLVLEGVAAGGAVLLERGQPGGREPVGRPGNLVRGGDLHAQVVHPGLLAGPALDEDELERGLGDG